MKKKDTSPSGVFFSLLHFYPFKIPHLCPAAVIKSQVQVQVATQHLERKRSHLKQESYTLWHATGYGAEQKPLCSNEPSENHRERKKGGIFFGVGPFFPSFSSRPGQIGLRFTERCERREYASTSVAKPEWWHSSQKQSVGETGELFAQTNRVKKQGRFTLCHRSKLAGHPWHSYDEFLNSTTFF